MAAAMGGWATMSSVKKVGTWDTFDGWISDDVAGLEQIMNQLMENGSKPVPLAEPEIDKLPRRVLDSRRTFFTSQRIPTQIDTLCFKDPLLGKDCQICQDTFIDRNTAMSVDGEPDSAGMKITVELPCHHCESDTSLAHNFLTNFS